jgi:predicted nuclease of predicted toxin-antitoxin system
MIRLYMDENVHGAITRGLRMRELDVLTAQEDGRDETDDSELLDRSRELGRVMFSQDDDLLKIATARQRTGSEFAGVIYAQQGVVSIRQCIEDLELIAGVCNPMEFLNRVSYLPLS